MEAKAHELWCEMKFQYYREELHDLQKVTSAASTPFAFDVTGEALGAGSVAPLLVPPPMARKRSEPRRIRARCKGRYRVTRTLQIVL